MVNGWFVCIFMGFWCIIWVFMDGSKCSRGGYLGVLDEGSVVFYDIERYIDDNEDGCVKMDDDFFEGRVVFRYKLDGFVGFERFGRSLFPMEFESYCNGFVSVNHDILYFLKMCAVFDSVTVGMSRFDDKDLSKYCKLSISGYECKKYEISVLVWNLLVFLSDFEAKSTKNVRIVICYLMNQLFAGQINFMSFLDLNIDKVLLRKNVSRIFIEELLICVLQTFTLNMKKCGKSYILNTCKNKCVNPKIFPTENSSLIILNFETLAILERLLSDILFFDFLEKILKYLNINLLILCDIHLPIKNYKNIYGSIFLMKSFSSISLISISGNFSVLIERLKYKIRKDLKNIHFENMNLSEMKYNFLLEDNCLESIKIKVKGLQYCHVYLHELYNSNNLLKHIYLQSVRISKNYWKSILDIKNIETIVFKTFTVMDSANEFYIGLKYCHCFDSLNRFEIHDITGENLVFAFDFVFLLKKIRILKFVVTHAYVDLFLPRSFNKKINETLEEVKFSGLFINSFCVKYILNNAGIKSLVLDNCRFEGCSFKDLGSTPLIARIQILKLKSVYISVEDLNFILELKNLVELEISNCRFCLLKKSRFNCERSFLREKCYSVKDTEKNIPIKIDYFIKLKKLKIFKSGIDLFSSNFSGYSTVYIKMKKLNISHSELFLKDMQVISKMQALVSLNISRCILNDCCISNMKNPSFIQNLISLNVSYIPIKIPDILYIISLEKIKKLKLSIIYLDISNTLLLNSKNLPSLTLIVFFHSDEDYIKEYGMLIETFSPKILKFRKFKNKN